MDVIQRPSITANILGGNYPVLAASVDAKINELLAFSVTVTVDKKGGLLTTADIRSLAAKAQAAALSPSPNNASLTISGFGGAPLNVSGIINGADLFADASGGLSCTVKVIGNDALVAGASYDPYASYINARKASDIIYSINKNNPNAATYVMLLGGGGGGTIAARLASLINCARTNWPSINQLGEVPGSIANAVSSAIAITESATGYVMKLLGRSGDSALLGGAPLNEATSRQVMNGLHSLLFASGLNFWQVVQRVCGEYELWYIPKLRQKGDGAIENNKYDKKGGGGNCSIWCTSFSFSGGNHWFGRAPCSGVVMFTQAYADSSSGSFSVRKSPASRMLAGSYPAGPKGKGAIYCYQAPKWVSLPLLSTYESGAVTQGTASSFASGSLSKSTRNKNIPKATYNTALQKQRPNAANSGEILSLLAKKEYYRQRLSPARCSVSGAYNGAPSAEVGEHVSVSSPGGTVAKGILEHISIRLSSSGLSTITYNLVGAEF